MDGYWLTLFWEMLAKIWNSDVLLIAFLILGFHQALKIIFHLTSFFYDKREVSVWKSIFTMGGESSVVGISVIFALAKSKSGLIPKCEDPLVTCLLLGFSFLLAGIFSVILIHSAYSETKWIGFFFGLRKYSLIAVSLILGLYSIAVVIYVC